MMIVFHRHTIILDDGGYLPSSSFIWNVSEKDVNKIIFGGYVPSSHRHPSQWWLYPIICHLKCVSEKD